MTDKKRDKLMYKVVPAKKSKMRQFCYTAHKVFMFDNRTVYEIFYFLLTNPA